MDASHKGEWGFPCPNPQCATRGTGKVKLFVNPAADRFHCWVCGWGHRSSLAALMVPGSAELREYLNERPTRARAQQPVGKLPCSTFPERFVPFRLRGDLDEAPYLHYLRGRNISDHTVRLYRMGRVTGRVVVPSFDQVGSVNFWSARTIYPEMRPSYVLPDATKDVVSNEHMVDWTDPVYLVEGIFDEIAIGSQAIALYGKFMQPRLALTLVRRRPPMTYVCLDDDARPEALDLVERLLGYDLPCSLLELWGKDPGELGMAGVQDAVARSKPVLSARDLVSARMA